MSFDSGDVITYCYDCLTYKCCSVQKNDKSQCCSKLTCDEYREILVTGHYHHLRSKYQGNRAWFQSPSLDKSIDFTERSGLWSHPAVLTFTVNNKGWANLELL